MVYHDIGFSVPRKRVLGQSLVHEKVYWAEMGTNTIRRANFDGTDIEDVVTEIDTPHDVAIDSVQGKVYWSSRDGSGLHRANFDGTDIENLLDSPVREYWGLTFDEHDCILYFINASGDGVNQVTCDTLIESTLLSNQVPRMSGLAIEFPIGIPATSDWALIIMGALILIAGSVLLARRRSVGAAE